MGIRNERNELLMAHSLTFIQNQLEVGRLNLALYLKIDVHLMFWYLVSALAATTKQFVRNTNCTWWNMMFDVTVRG